jgi:hypothetical protein
MTTHAPFLTDEPDSLGADAFGHTDYAETLHSIVTDAEPPLAIGLLGRWGLGKSSIVGALQSRLSGDAETAFAYFDAWRYEEDSLRRQFLLDVATDLEKDGRLKKFDVKKKLRDVEYETQEVEEKLGWSKPRIARLVIVAAIFGLIALALILLGVVHSLSEGSFGKKVLVALVTAVVAGLAAAISQSISIDAVSLTRRRLEDPDRFAAKFVEVLEALEPRRLVIAIDNLDRSSPEKAVEVLSTIKTFLEPTVSPEALPRSSARPTVEKQIVFVIAVDDEALRRHLSVQETVRSEGFDDAAAARYVEEYLAKFFGARLPIREILVDDMRDYVARRMTPLAEARSLGPEETRDLITVVNAGLRGNPRGVKQFHNDLEVRLRLLEEREREKDGGRPGIAPPVSGEVAMVAKLALIEREWPGAFRRLQVDPLVFDLWEIDAKRYGMVDWDRTRAQAEEGNPPNHGAIDTAAMPEWRRFATFLRTTTRVRSARIRALLNLRQSEIEVTLPSYGEFRDALTADERDRVGELLEAASAEERTALAAKVPDILAEEIERAYIDSARGVVDVVISTHAFERHEEVRREVIRSAAEVPELKGEMPNLDPVAVLAAGRLLDLETRRLLFEPFLLRFHRNDLAAEERAVTAHALAPFVGDFAAEDREELAGAIATGLSEEFDLILPFVEADGSLLAAAPLDAALASMASQRGQGQLPESPWPLHRQSAAPIAVVRIGMRSALGQERGVQLLDVVRAIFEGSVGDPEDLAADLGGLRELAGSVEEEHPDQFELLARTFQQHFAEVQQQSRAEMLAFVGEVLARSPEYASGEVAPAIADQLFGSPGQALVDVADLDPVPEVFRRPFLERLDPLKTTPEFWGAALEQLRRIDPEGFAPHLIGAFDALLRADHLDAVDQLLGTYRETLAEEPELFTPVATAALSDRVAQDNPGPPELLARMVAMLNVEEVDELGRRYAEALGRPAAGEQTRLVLEELPAEAASLRFLAAHFAIGRIEVDAGVPTVPLLSLVCASVGRLSEGDQDRFAAGLAAVVRNWPIQAGEPAVAALGRVERLRVEAADVIAEALIEIEPSFGEVESRSALLYVVWRLRVKKGSRVWKRLRDRSAELAEGEGSVEQELASRVQGWDDA